MYTFKKIQLIEDMEPETAIRFLSSHYYYHSMYKWFWIYFNLNDKKENSVLYNHAAEIAFCENKSMKIVTDYFSLAISYSRNEMQIQRLWHQLSVFLTLRGELSAAKDAIEKCKDLLKHVTDLNERICRTAEYYNSLALIYFKEKDYEKAATILNSAEKTLEIINIQNKRSLDIKRILEVNKKKLEKLIVQTIRRETF